MAKNFSKQNPFNLKKPKYPMGKTQTILFITTLLSLIAISIIAFDIFSKTTGTQIPNKNLNDLTGNFLLNLEDNIPLGQNLQGEIIINNEELGEYGFISLSKNKKQLEVKTFNLNKIQKEKINDKQTKIKIENLINYTFQEKGTYELFFSNLEFNVKKNFIAQ